MLLWLAMKSSRHSAAKGQTAPLNAPNNVPAAAVSRVNVTREANELLAAITSSFYPAGAREV